MTISVTYDALNAREKARWAILYMAIGHNGDLDPGLIQKIRVQLSKFKLGEPILRTVPASDSGLETIDANQVSFLKWPIRSATEITPEAAGDVRGTIRSTINRELIAAGNEVLQTDVKPAGVSLTGDQGIPPTPQVGPAPVPLWPVGVAAILMSFPLMKWAGK